MFKDYYKILEIPPTATPQEIKSAYREMSMKWHPDRNPDKDVTSIMQNINEAYAILKDPDKRNRYDAEYRRFEHFSYDGQNASENKQYTQQHTTWEYDYDVQDEDVREDIKNARQYAEDIVAEFMASFKKATHNAASGAWDEAKGYVWAAIIFVIIGIIVQLCSSASHSAAISESVPVEPAEDVPATSPTISQIDGVEEDTPDGWTTYWIDNGSFSISIPQSLELRRKDDQYTRRLENKGVAVNTNNVIFQQKGLSNSKAGTEDNHYCRVIISHAKCQPDEVYKSDETEPITGELQAELLEMVSAELAPGQDFVEGPTFKWIDIHGQKAIEIRYTRTGNNGNTTRCAMYLLFNCDEFVKMIVAYREQESDLWASDMNRVIKTFNWK